MDSELKLKGHALRNQDGFTLLEIMSVLVILGVLFSVIIHEFTTLTDTAYKNALHAAVRELNIRETLIWSNFKISFDGWAGDDDIFTLVNTEDLGGGYSWNPSVGKLGGKLHFGPQSIDLTRTGSTNISAGSWN
jgi:prepilin-type N-terminal cleavage/methylation domain-containing protein